MEIGNLPVKEFRAKIVKMIQELRMGMDAQSEKKFNKDLVNIKNKQT